MSAYLLIFLIAIQCASRSKGVQIKSNSSDHIGFPGSIQEVPLNRYGSDEDEIPEECKHLTYCTIKPADYPQEKFNNLFADAIPLQQTNLVLSDLNERAGDPEDIDNCETLVTHEPLYRVRTKLGDWRTVIQAPEKNYMQQVRLETCKNARKACFTKFPPQTSYTTFCKQKFATWEFMVESKTGSRNFETVKIELPTCCSCYYKSNFGI